MAACTQLQTNLIGTGILHLEDGEEVVESCDAYSHRDILALVPILHFIEDNLTSRRLTDKLIPRSQ